MGVLEYISTYSSRGHASSSAILAVVSIAVVSRSFLKNVSPHDLAEVMFFLR